MAITITKEMREAAKTEEKCLFQISISTRHLSDEARKKFGKRLFMGKFEMTGPMSVEHAAAIYSLLMKLRKQEKA